MAFGKTQASSEAKIIRYVGVGSVSVLAVNPNKSELEKLYNTELEKEPEYMGTSDVNGQQVPQVRINFVVKTDPEKNNGIEFTTGVSFFIKKAYRFNRDNTKVQVIDKYGRTCWVTKEQCQAHEIPMYKNGPANIDKDYRPCFIGEEDLTNFIKNYLNIPNVMKYVNEKWVMVDNPADSECRLDNIEKYFTGDFSELKNVLALQPTNKIKILFGVKSDDNNRQIQSFYTQMTLKNNASDYSKLDKDVQERKANGSYATTEFFIGDLKEYNVESTSFESKPADDPFSTSAPTSSPWDVK